MAGLTSLERNIYLIKNRTVMEKQAAETKRTFLLTCIEIAKLWSGFPLYITNKLCIRLRLYPEQPLLSRTSGTFKHLLCDFTPKKLTLRGLINLLSAYYAFYPSKFLDFIEFTEKTVFSKKTGMQTLYNYFEENSVTIESSSDPLCVMLLHTEILKSKTNGVIPVLV